LPPHGSVFIVFKKATGNLKLETRNLGGNSKLETGNWKPLMELTGPWTVTFDPKFGGPTNPFVFNDLTDWTNQSDLGIKYYSGKATYRKTFDFPPVSSFKFQVSNLFLSLGVVHNLAHVRLNGHDLGVVWCAPWQVDISKAIRAGSNDLEVDVINLWPNRLIGDGKLPPEKRITQTNIDRYYKGEHKLLPSGLLGPVRLMTCEE
jgi:hypothetical protein